MNSTNRNYSFFSVICCRLSASRQAIKACLMIVALTLTSPAIAQSIYWTTGSDALLRGSTDGTSRELLLDTGFGLATGLAINQRDQQLYWVESIPTDVIRRASLDGSNVEDLVSLSNDPAGIDLDLASNKMYWTERFSNRVQRANLDGTDVETVVMDAVEPRGLRIDAVNDHIYWVELGTNRLRRSNLDGSDVVDIITSGMNRPFDVELDVDRQLIYWSELGGSSRSTGSIYLTDFDGTNPQVIASGLSQPSSIELDEASQQLWFAHGLNFSIDVIDLASGNSRTVFSQVGIPQYIVVETIPEPRATTLLVLGALTTVFGTRSSRSDDASV